MASEITPAEIAIRLEQNSRDIQEATEKVEQLIERMGQTFMPRETLDVRLESIEDRMKASDASVRKDLDALNVRLTVMQSWQTWAVRLIVGTLVTVLITGIVGVLFRSGVLG